MHHFKIPIYQKQDIFVAKQHIFTKTPFQALREGFSQGKSTQFLVSIPTWIGNYCLLNQGLPRVLSPYLWQISPNP